MEKNEHYIYQLDDLVNDLERAVYQKSQDYRVQLMDISELKMERFKLSDYPLDKIIEGQIQFLEELDTGYQHIPEMVFKRQGKTAFGIRLVAYPDKNEPDRMSSPINVNQIIRTLLSELVVTNKTENILLPIINIDVPGPKLEKYSVFKPYVDPTKYYSLQLTERFHSMITLDKFLEEYTLDAQIILSIISQVTDLLYQINLVYPKFRCNQLFPELIDCYLKEERGVIYPQLKVGHFYLSTIDGLVSNEYLRTLDIFQEEAYGDLYSFLNSLWTKIGQEISKYPDVANIFKEILPESIRGNRYLDRNKWMSLNESVREQLNIRNIRKGKFFEKNQKISINIMEKNKKGLSEGGPHEGGPHEGGPQEGGPHEEGPHEGGPHEGGPYEGGPHEGGPQEGGPHEGGPYEGGPQEEGPQEEQEEFDGQEEQEEKEETEEDEEMEGNPRHNRMRERSRQPARIVHVPESTELRTEYPATIRYKTYQGVRYIKINNQNGPVKNTMQQSTTKGNILAGLLGSNPGDVRIGRPDYTQYFQQPALQTTMGYTGYNEQQPGILPAPEGIPTIQSAIQSPAQPMMQLPTMQPMMQPAMQPMIQPAVSTGKTGSQAGMDLQQEAMYRYLMATNQLPDPALAQAQTQTAPVQLGGTTVHPRTTAAQSRDPQPFFFR
jgi:hypothetical protein